VNKSLRDCLTMFAVQVTLYIMVVVNYRAVAQADIPWSVASDTLIASANFLVLRKIVKNLDNMNLFFGYVAGSAVGSVAGILVSKMILQS
jgi:hypothetical protein